MAKLVLQFDDRVLSECTVGARAITIGRLPDNPIVIDNPAVSGRHARVFIDASGVVIEDLESTNGTFVNERRITRHSLQDGDVISIGKHKLVFDRHATGPAAAATEERVPELGGTMMLDTRDYKSMLAKSDAEPHQAAPEAIPTAPNAGGSGAAPLKPAAASRRVGVLRVLSGRSEQEEYRLPANTATIGKSKTALVRLKGWFKPAAAVSIARTGDAYVLTPLARASVNGQRVSARYELKDGDVLQVSGLTLEFRLQREP
jgi:pSer/pThr/pTyr-binding forkhead associated (FHA) protein